MTNLDKTKEREAWIDKYMFSSDPLTFTPQKIADYWLERMALHEQKVRDQIATQIETKENPYQKLDLMKNDLASWALIEGGKRLGYGRALEELTKIARGETI